MGFFHQFWIAVFCLFSLFNRAFPISHEKQFRTHSLLPIANNFNCETIRFRTLEDECHRTRAKYPMIGSCTKYVRCYRNEDDDLVSGEEECDGGTIFDSKLKTCVYSNTPSNCLQTQCGELRLRPSVPSEKDYRSRRHPPRTVKNQQPPKPLSCETDEEEDGEELEFGKIPKQCPPVKIGTNDQAPNWNTGPAPVTKTPSNMTGYYNPRGTLNEQVPDSGSRGQWSTGFGNREAGQAQAPGYGGDQGTGQGQGGQSVYGNRGGQGQWQWPKDPDTTPSKADTDKYKPSGKSNGYPSFPGAGTDGQKPVLTPQSTTSTKKPDLQEQEEEEFNNKEQHSGENSEARHEEEQSHQGEEPFHQSQVQNSSVSEHRKMKIMIAIFCTLVSLVSFRY